jgi:pyruvate/2-oxoglutarate dehydrogenase complex dihydrolipoamide acyltransferase (E2) component
MVLFWYVNAGEPAVEGQDLCEIESAKAVVVVTAPASGTLEEVLVAEGEPVASEQVLGRIRVG